MGRLPYRAPSGGLPTKGRSAGDQAAALEERCLAWVLLTAGLLGLGIGLGSPRTNAVELVLGAMLVWLARRTFLASSPTARR